MTKRIIPISAYIPASEAADLLSKKLGRRIDPDYIRKIKGVQFVRINSTSKLYSKDDILATNIRKRERKNERS